MGRRLALQSLLETLMGTEPEQKLKVYFQPKPKMTLTYPCILYERDSARSHHADNIPYSHTKRYQVTVIDKNPDSEIPDKIAALPLSRFIRAFAVDNLTHDIYSLYF
jgi:hypothetical protein